MLSTYWINRLKQYEALYVGFSGGLDSTVLLHTLANEPAFKKKITAVYINHGLSHHAEQWLSHCKKISQQFNVFFLSHALSFPKRANIEAQARQARYDFFHSILKLNQVLLLGHHQDDQAETLLLQLFRGAGINGLSAMVSWRPFSQGYLARPLLACERTLLKKYAKHYQLNWIEDESNIDCSYTRNFLRQQIIPSLQTRWPAINTNLARTTLHCQQAQSNLTDLAYLDYPNLKEISNKLLLEPLKNLSEPRKQNVLSVWLKKNLSYLPNSKIFKRLLDEVISAREDRMPEVGWKNFWIYRYQNTLYLIKSKQKMNSEPVKWVNFPKSLKLPNELGILKANLARSGLVIPKNAWVTVRFRRGGEHFYWHQQTKVLKKLLQAWGVPPWLRDQIPLIYINEQLAAVIGYAISDKFYQSSANNCYQLQLDY